MNLHAFYEYFASKQKQADRIAELEFEVKTKNRIIGGHKAEKTKRKEMCEKCELRREVV